MNELAICKFSTRGAETVCQTSPLRKLLSFILTNLSGEECVLFNVSHHTLATFEFNETACLSNIRQPEERPAPTSCSDFQKKAFLSDHSPGSPPLDKTLIFQLSSASNLTTLNGFPNGPSTWLLHDAEATLSRQGLLLQAGFEV